SFFLLIRPPPISTLFPYTTLFRSLLVVEISSFQLESCTRFHPRVGILLNITPDHLDRHGSMDRYAGLKARLFQVQDESEFRVQPDRKSTRLNSSHLGISYAVFCLK